MGGNKANRTKGNIKPSSSARMANLFLDTVPANPITFNTFGVVGGGEPSGSTTTDEIVSGVDSSVLATIRHLSKKCNLTKMNALRELGEYFEQQDEASVCAILPYWCKSFTKLALDPDDEVRLSTMKSQRKLVEKVKKNLAPYLKQIIWPWMVALHDDARTVKVAAREAFDAAFPDHKQPEVLNFCREEIFTNVNEILFQSKGENPANELMDKVQSSKAVHWRAILGCLQTLRMLSERLGQNEPFDQYIQQLLERRQFWNYSNHANDFVRAGWFTLCFTLTITRHHLVKLYLTQLNKIVFNSLSQKSNAQGPVRGAIWQYVVTVIQMFDECFQGINMEKSFLPHLYKELESCSRDTGVLFANMQPVLIKLSKNLDDSSMNKLMASFMTGLCNPVIINNDFEHLFESFFHTLEHISKHPVSYKCDESFVENLLVKYLPKLMISRFSDSYTKVKAVFFSRFTHFIQNLPSKSRLSTVIGDCLHQTLTELFTTEDAKFRNLNIFISILFHQQDYYEKWALKPFPSPVEFKPDTFDKVTPMSEGDLSKLFPILKELKTFFITSSTALFKDFEFWIFVKRFVDICYQVDADLLSKEDEIMLETKIFNSFSNSEALTKNEATWMIAVFLSMVINGSHLAVNSINKLLKVKSHLIVTSTLNQLSSNDSPKVIDYIKNGMEDCPITLIQNYLERNFTKSGEGEKEEDVHLTLLSSLFNLLSKHGQSHVLLNAISFGSARRRRQLAVFFLKKIQPGPNSNDPLLDLAIESLFQQCFHEETQQSDESILQLLPILLQLSPEDDSWPVLEHLANMIRTDLQQLDQHSLVCCKIEQLLAQVLKQDQLLCLRLLKTILPTNQNLDHFQAKFFWYLWLKGLIFKPNLSEETDWEDISLELPAEMFICSMQLRLLNFIFDHDSQLIHNQTFVEILKQQLKPICQSAGYAQILDELHALKIYDKLFQDLPERLKLFEEIAHQLSRLNQFLPKKVLEQLLNDSVLDDCLWFWVGLEQLMNFSSRRLQVLDFRPSSSNHFLLLAKHYNPDQLVSYVEENPNLFESGVFMEILSKILLVQPLDFERHVSPIMSQLQDFESFACLPLEQASQAFQLTSTIIQTHALHLNQNNFDMIFNQIKQGCILLSSLQSNDLLNVSICTYLRSLFQLVLSAHRHLQTFEADMQSISNEWQGCHSEPFVRVLFRTFLRIKHIKLTFIQLQPYRLMVQCLVEVDNRSLLDQQAQDSFKPAPFRSQLVQPIEYCVLSPPLHNLLCSLSSMLQDENFCNRYLAHNLTMKYLTEAKINGEDDDLLQVTNLLDIRDELFLQPPDFLISPLHQLDSLMNLLLEEYSLGRFICLLPPSNDSYKFTLSYLSCWLQLLRLHASLPNCNRPQLLGFLSNHGLVEHLFENLFKLMPFLPDENKSQSDIQQMFDRLFDFIGRHSSDQVQHLACQLYLAVLRQLPASIRLWIKKQEKWLQSLINTFTIKFASPKLIAEELDSVQNYSSPTLKSLNLRTRPHSREVLGSYTVEEISIDVSIKLPKNHPIDQVEIDGGKRVGVDAAKWRTWLLQLTAFLAQNGSVVDGLLLWANNLSKRFDGVDECMICFYILHYHNSQLPRVSCKKCRKKFHSACLNKWFSTSNNRTCPLCRNEFY